MWYLEKIAEMSKPVRDVIQDLRDYGFRHYHAEDSLHSYSLNYYGKKYSAHIDIVKKEFHLYGNPAPMRSHGYVVSLMSKIEDNARVSMCAPKTGLLLYAKFI